ncbi:DivIVA domain-containing protein [Mycoplasma testudineum]|uniref:DivIVA domain-containing protein n=1 Tax=Mycoplasma testudineum TaxID=244584 RepID=A0A4R6IHT4_9MOLU|nr:DivIVA domain-containing protein [Mycoplasma testudineum]OYD27071.1 hypothetical protein CG473_00250 [Mycoplasma testudineum]TDO21175.1 DivIVA domain-containing protein [Mycoplasma testudineum]
MKEQFEQMFVEMKNKTFNTQINGYDASEVDDFIDHIYKQLRGISDACAILEKEKNGIEIEIHNLKENLVACQIKNEFLEAQGSYNERNK